MVSFILGVSEIALFLIIITHKKFNLQGKIIFDIFNLSLIFLVGEKTIPLFIYCLKNQKV